MEKSTLFLVPTPIGNLQDITLRALDVLGAVDLIVCEDTRHSRKLLNHYRIKKPLISYERFSEAKKASEILKHLLDGKNVALISDAGTPIISDPGSRLIARARENGIRIEALPGPSALTAALSASGYEPPFYFLGFFPRRKEMMKKAILKMASSRDVYIFYESPRRVLKTLKMIQEKIPDRQVCIAREISKVHEEYLMGTVQEVVSRMEGREVKGEITVLLKGAEESGSVDLESVRGRVDALLREGYTKKDILRILSEETGLNRNVIYKMLIELV
jgi:16S rRNA (cytidine1402-2'-O)-methyltransferase